jgi:hypothetical protein
LLSGRRINQWNNNHLKLEHGSGKHRRNNKHSTPIPTFPLQGEGASVRQIAG